MKRAIIPRRSLTTLLLVGVSLLESSVLVQAFPLSSSKITRYSSASFSPLPRKNGVALKSTQDDKDEYDTPTNSEKPKTRRQMMTTLVSSLIIASTLQQEPAVAYERTFPVDLDFENGDTSRDLTALREAKIARQKASTKKSMDYVSADPLTFRGPKDLLTCAVWGGALWLLSGSRSNPLVTPLANALYDPEEEEWLKDRNEGMFASVPPYLFFVLSCAFFFLGIVTDRILLLATEGDANVSLQLAGVSFIAGGSLELGRIFSGEKRQTRQESDRESQLEREFAEFADQRLVKGGNCHRSEVVKAFRRYYAKVSVYDL